MYHKLLVVIVFSAVMIMAEEQQPCQLGEPDKPLHTPRDCEWKYVQETNENCGTGKYELICAQDVDMSCFCKPDRGSCTGAVHFFYYEPSVDRCLPFLYSGCGGNTNRFPNEDDCSRKCDSVNREKEQVDPLCINVLCAQESDCIGGRCVPRATTTPAVGCNGSKCPSGTRCNRNTCISNTGPFTRSTVQSPDRLFFRCALVTCPMGSICMDNVGCVLAAEPPSTEKPVSWMWQSFGPSRYPPKTPRSEPQTTFAPTLKPLFGWITWWKA